MKSVRLYTLALLILATLAARWVWKHRPPAGVEIVEQSYDIRDLLFDPGGLNAPAPPLDEFGFPISVARTAPRVIAGQTNSIALERQILVRKLIQRLEQGVAPDSWKSRGGNIGEITENAGRVVVRQTPENQYAMRALIDKMLAERAVQITLEFRVLHDESIVEYTRRLPGEWREVAGGRIYEPFIDATERAELLRHQNWQGGLTSPRITLSDGQRADAVIAVQNAYFYAQPDRGTKPGLRLVPEGTYLDARATMNDDRQSIKLESTFRMNRLIQLEPTTQPIHDPASPWVMIPHVANSAVSLTADVPNETGLLVELHPKRIPAEPGASDPPVFILVTPKLIKPDQIAR